MMSGQRALRMREGLKRETSEILRMMKDPRIGFVSVTDVEVSRDLRHVKVFVSVYGDEDEKAATMDALVKAQGFVRTELGKRIRLRHTPEIVFRPDESIERGARISALLKTVSVSDDPSATDEGAAEPAEPNLDESVEAPIPSDGGDDRD